MNVIERAMGQSLKLLNQFAGSEFAEKLGLHEPAQKLLYKGTRGVAKAATDAARRAGPVVKLLQPQRMQPQGETKRPALFDLRPTEEQQLVIDTMGRYADEQLRGMGLEADEKSAPPSGLLDETVDLGLAQLAVPEALGGAGETRSPITNTLVIEQLARGDMGLAVAALAPLGVIHALVEFGTADQQGKYLPAFAEEAFTAAAFALVEPRPLFTPERLSTRATREGKGYVLNGEKSMVPLAETADLLLVAADLAGKPELFLVERGAEGLHVEAEPAMGLRGAALGRLKLEGVKVSCGARLGGDDGADVSRLIDLSRIAWSAAAVGTGQAMLDYVKPYCNERIAFGEPITNRQSVAFLIADMAIELEGMRLMTYRAASRAEQGLSFKREAYLARMQAASKGMYIGTSGVQLLGGHGFTKEHPVELWYRQLRAVGIMEGALLV